MQKKYIITGGAGFIGANFIHYLIQAEPESKILNLDKLTYAGNSASLKTIEKHPRYSFIKGDICDDQLIEQIVNDFKPSTIVHFAAESHVDRSITGPSEFINTNITGTFNLLEIAKKHWLDNGWDSE